MKAKGSCSSNPKKGRSTSRPKMPALQEEVAFCSSSETSLVVPAGSAPPPPPPDTVADDHENIARGGVATPFPWKLHEMLEDSAKEGNEWIVGWQPHGHSFLVHKPKLFVEKIMPTYFNQSKFASFQRQLNLYGFHRLTQGKDKGAYYHNCFVRNQVHLCRGMVRQKIKGTKVRRTSQAGGEPDFYTMTNIVPIEAPLTPGNEEEHQPSKTNTKKKTNKGTVKATTKKTPKSTKRARKETRPSLLVVEKTPPMAEDEEMKEIVVDEQQPDGFPPLPQSTVMPELPELAPVQREQTTITMTTTTASPPSSPGRRADVISAKERAHRLRQERERQERLNAVRDALKQTEMLFDDDEAASFGGGGGNNNNNNNNNNSSSHRCRRGSSASSSSLGPTISIKPMIPSVSPLDSEVSDFEDDSTSSSGFPPLRLHHHHHQHKKISSSTMPPLVNPPLIPATLEPLDFNKTEPLVPRFTLTHSTRETKKTEADVKGGDVLFFEGKPFRYLEHLDSLPPPPTSISSSSSMVVGGGRPAGQPQAPGAAAAAQMQKPKVWTTTVHPTFGGNAAGGFPRDSLQSLMRVDPQAIFNFNIRPMP